MCKYVDIPQFTLLSEYNVSQADLIFETMKLVQGKVLFGCIPGLFEVHSWATWAETCTYSRHAVRQKLMTLPLSVGHCCLQLTAGSANYLE